MKRIRKKIKEQSGIINIRSLSVKGDARTLFENFVSLSIVKATGYILPIITLPYLAKTIGVDKFGEIAFAASVIIYFQTFVDFGFNFIGVKNIARVKNDIHQVSEIFSNIMATRLLLMVISFCLLLLCVYTIDVFYENRLILLLTFLYIPGYLFFPEWFFQAMEQMKYIALLNLLSKLLFTLLVFIVIKEKKDFIYQPVLIALGYYSSGIIAITMILRKFKVKFILPNLNAIYLALKESWNMFLSLFLPNLYSNFSTILLRTYGGEIATGIYSGGSRFISLFNELSDALSRTFYPFLARRLDKHAVFVIINGLISLLASLGLFFGADLLIRIFYTPEFQESAKVIRIMAITPFFLYLIDTYGVNYLVLINKVKVLRNIVLFCSLMGFLLSWFFVIRYHYIGVAILLTFVRGIYGSLTWSFAKKYKKVAAAKSEF